MPITKLFADGGVIIKNPSPFGGTWAYCGVDENDERIIEASGFISLVAEINSMIWIVDRRSGQDRDFIGDQPARPSNRPITNNHTEQIAVDESVQVKADCTVSIDAIVSNRNSVISRSRRRWVARKPV